jgi:hypothetical protein
MHFSDVQNGIRALSRDLFLKKKWIMEVIEKKIGKFLAPTS